MISPAGCTVGRPTIPFCRSVTTNATVVSTFVRGMVFPFGLGGRHIGPVLLRRLLGLFPGESHAQHCAYCSAACEENNKCRVASARNFSDPKQDVTDDQIEQCPDNVHRWR